MRRWQIRRIEELGRVVTGRTPSSDHSEDFGIEYPFVTPSDIPKTQQKYVTTERFISKKGKDAYKPILLPTKSVCVVCIGATIGKVCLTDRPSFSNQQINAILPKKGEYDADFAYYLSTTLKDALVNFSGGAATPIVNKSTFSSIKVLVPRYDEQKKIAAVLSAYDDLIENNRRRVALLEKMAEEIYREWFVRLRFPDHKQAKFEKGVPMGWRELASNEVFDVLSGGTPKTDVAAYWDGGIPFFTPKDADDNFYVLDTEKHITVSGLNSCNSRLYPKDTIFITARGTVGKLALANREMAMNQSCYALAPKMEGPAFFHFMAIKGAIKYLKGVSKSGVFDNIIVDTFKTVPILMPSSDLIVGFNKVAGPLFHQISGLMETNILLAKNRDMLLSRLISGKLSVEDLDIHFPPSMEESKHER